MTMYPAHVLGLLIAVLAYAAAVQPATPATPAAEPAAKASRILFLHHSTGHNVWKGGVAEWFETYNGANGTNYQISQQEFPKDEPYGWKNYPHDYWNIWVKNAGPKPYMNEPTLEILTAKYDVIVFKHCFPVAAIKPDTGKGDVAGEEKRTENYKLQYEALKKRMKEFPKTRFILWTGAMLCKTDTDEAAARRAKDFFKWVKEVWDEKGDNIYLWDFETLETEGGLYLKKEYEAEPGNSHPGPAFCKRAARLFAKRIVDVIEGRGDRGSLTGE